MKIPLLVIAGPTGVGKTATAVKLGGRVPLEIVSADSRQVYRGMDVATGKPTVEERAAAVHHLIDVVAPDDRYHAERFRREARAIVADVHARGRLAVVVGGTGLYIRALLRGLDPAPPADAEYRRELQGLIAREGAPTLHDRLKREAPELARRLHPHDHVRIMRALEVVRAGGPPSRQQWARQTEEYDVLYVGLTMERGALRRRLAERAAGMVEHGLLDEVKTLLACGYDPSLPSMHGIGYREFVQVAAGILDAGEALRRMQRDTMRYAKRQWTWFAREPEVQWIDVDLGGGPEGVAALLAEQLARRGLIR